jgi:hypothetical protein
VLLLIDVVGHVEESATASAENVGHARTLAVCGSARRAGERQRVGLDEAQVVPASIDAELVVDDVEIARRRLEHAALVAKRRRLAAAGVHRRRRVLFTQRRLAHDSRRFSYIDDRRTGSTKAVTMAEIAN